MPNPPQKKQAVIYIQDDLSDFATNGGSIIELFDQEISSGHSIVVLQTPSNAPAVVLAVLHTKADIEDRKRASAHLQDKFSKLFEESSHAA